MRIENVRKKHPFPYFVRYSVTSFEMSFDLRETMCTYIRKLQHESRGTPSSNTLVATSRLALPPAMPPQNQRYGEAQNNPYQC